MSGEASAEWVRPRVAVAVRISVALAAALAMAPGAARAGKPRWPTPAAGPSESGGPELIFTFDDGPHARWSAKVLDALAAHKISAIFYWVGHRVEGTKRGVKQRRALVDRAVREGHLLGNHTVHHVHLCHSAPPIAAEEIDHARALLEGLAILPVILFRAPYGDRCRKLIALLGERGLDHLHWDIDPHEWDGLSGKTTATFVIARLKRLRGRAVLLMHDTKASTARALPIILDWIEAENRRRLARGERPIRVLSGPDLLIERGRGPLWDWGEEAALVARGRLLRAFDGLIPGTPAPSTLSRAEPGSGPAW